MVSTFKDKDPSRELLAMQRALGKNGTTGAASSVQPIQSDLSSFED